VTIKDQLEPLIREFGVNEVADQAGIPRPRLYDWFAGRRDMYAERIDRIIEVLGYEANIRKPPRKRKKATAGAA